MEKFKRALRGYDPDEVNKFLDQIIKQVEEMIEEIKDRDSQIIELQKIAQENIRLKDKVEQYERMEGTLNKAIFMAQKTSEQIKLSAHQESTILLDEAKQNASRIINEALLRAEKTELEVNMLQRNVNIFKRRLRDIIETQLEVVDDIEKLEL
ncbi:MAG: DivIVA domain-containing protein [Bacilli bacterium]|nr:DivIVA domain-containing protein [Bacilli bacterium]MDD4283220.1 DivIVA domain-containing protein [Bacilli bacterium]MDD4400090.1 DivIVA domain-containing protein [Dysgonamonadaceae bacterium]